MAFRLWSVCVVFQLMSLLGPVVFFQVSAAHAADPKSENVEIPAQNVFLKWIGPRGQELKPNWNVRFQWVWAEQKATTAAVAPPPRPQFRMWVQIAPSQTVDNVKGSGVRFLKPTPDSPVLGSPFDEKNGLSLAADLDSPSGSGTIVVKAGENDFQEFGFILQPRPSASVLLVHPACKEAGIDVRSKKNEGQHLYLAAFCRMEGSQLHLYMIQSPDSDWKAGRVSKTAAKLVHKAPLWKMYQVDALLLTKRIGKPFAEFTVSRSGSTTVSVYEALASSEFSGGKRWRFQVGIGPSLLKYKESPLGIDLSEIVATFKFSASYDLSRKFDIGGNFFINALPLSQSPSSVTAARFYGINARLGYTLPFKFKNITIRALAGWYFWGMLVSDNSYGIKSLAGPQIFLTSAFRTGNGKPWWLFFKFAPISTSPSEFSLSNREIAFGLGYQLSSVRAKRPLSLNFAFADTRASSTASQNSAQVASYSLSLDMGF